MELTGKLCGGLLKNKQILDEKMKEVLENCIKESSISNEIKRKEFARIVNVKLVGIVSGEAKNKSKFILNTVSNDNVIEKSELIKKLGKEHGIDYKKWLASTIVDTHA